MSRCRCLGVTSAEECDTVPSCPPPHAQRLSVDFSDCDIDVTCTVHQSSQFSVLSEASNSHLLLAESGKYLFSTYKDLHIRVFAQNILSECDVLRIYIVDTSMSQLESTAATLITISSYLPRCLLTPECREIFILDDGTTAGENNDLDSE